MAPGFLPLIVGHLAEDPDDPEVVGDDDRVDLRRFLPDRLPQGGGLLAGQAESVERPRELPGELAEGRLLVPAAAGFRPVGQRDVEARPFLLASDLDPQGLADDLVQVRVVDQTDPVREHLGEQDRSLVVRVERPADDDPLAELGVLAGAGRDARLLGPVAQGRDDRVCRRSGPSAGREGFARAFPADPGSG